MAPGGNRMNGPSAIIAVIALYAFVLQGFLGGLMPGLVGADGRVLCLSGTTVGPGDPAPDGQALHTHAECCTAAQIAATAMAPQPSSALVAWPVRLTVKIAFAVEAANGARAPPGAMPQPRGPPAV